jgi:hypothetical protein
VKETEAMKILRMSALVVLLAGAAAFGQPQTQPRVVEVDKSTGKSVYFARDGRIVQVMNDGAVNPFELQQESTQLAQQYVKAEKEGDKDEIRKKLEDAVNKQFNAHMEQQEKELKELENQLEHLRSVLRKRQEQKDRIVRRRIEQLINEAEGLGWTGPGGGNDFWTPRPMMGYPYQPGAGSAAKKAQVR